MYCNNCGHEILSNSKFCSVCGMKTDNNQTQQSIQVGYSTRIHDPAFNKYVSKSNKISLIFSVVVAIIAVVGFSVTGEVSDDLDNPEALFIGFAIAGMFLAIGFFQVIFKKRSKTWDGQIIDKRIENKRRKVHSNDGDDDYYMQNYTLYRVIIRSTTGKKYEIRAEDNDRMFNYYQVGDYIRHHAGLNSYEKYDKTNDTVIICNACTKMNSIQDEYCTKCKCPLLK